ncbi:hypothetical protein [Rubrivivax albus]|uniref:Uncharacterized protein n=1 Tax=Rubrivivax albus TaxID=2499835 RepID=A0A3S2VUZ5_9BURK|nr:hypothetical protein [Rubrivivax albus]RVT49457.1 hypothetical protein ENE75_20525 [Rubrivivax albus]
MRLLLAGDAGIAWPALGRWVASAFVLPGGLAEPGSAIMADAALRAHPADRLLYFAGGPEHALRDASLGDPAQALTEWAVRARAVLRVVHAHPGRCLLVDIDDVMGRADDLLAGVSDWLEINPQPVEPPPTAAHEVDGEDVLWRMAASACVAARADIETLAQEWLASCIPVGPARAPTSPMGADAALVRLRQLHNDLAEHHRARQQLHAERDALARQHAEQALWAQSLEHDLQRQEEAVASLDGELARQREQQSVREAENERLLADLVLHRAQIDQLLEHNDALAKDAASAHAVAEAAKAEHLETKAAAAAAAAHAAAEAERIAADAARAAAAATEAKLAAEGALEDAGHRLATVTDELDQVRQRRQALEGDLQSVRTALAEARLELGAVQAEREELTAQLIQAHSDAAAAQALASEPAALGNTWPTGNAGSARAPVVAGGVSLVRLRDEAPHREAHFQFTGVLTPKGHLPELDVRLVDHHGRPGIVIFGNAAQPPFSGWRQTGDEAGQGYMLVVPSDGEGPRTLSPLPAADWAFLRSLADLLLLASEEPEFGLRPAWRQVAQRLCLQLDSLPPRLRYDNLRVVTNADGSCVVHLEAVTWGSRQLSDVDLRWRPEGATGPDAAGCALAWLLPEDPDVVPPLTLWPEAPDGRLQAAWPLAVGAGFGAAARRRWWAAQPEADRRLLLAVLDALPAAAAFTDTARQARWQAAAMALHAEARKTLRALRLRSALRRR